MRVADGRPGRVAFRARGCRRVRAMRHCFVHVVSRRQTARHPAHARPRAVRGAGQVPARRRNAWAHKARRSGARVGRRTRLNLQPLGVGFMGALEVAHAVQGSALASIALAPVGLDRDALVGVLHRLGPVLHVGRGTLQRRAAGRGRRAGRESARRCPARCTRRGHARARTAGCGSTTRAAGGVAGEPAARRSRPSGWNTARGCWRRGRCPARKSRWPRRSSWPRTPRCPWP